MASFSVAIRCVVVGVVSKVVAQLPKSKAGTRVQVNFVPYTTPPVTNCRLRLFVQYEDGITNTAGGTIYTPLSLPRPRSLLHLASVPPQTFSPIIDMYTVKV